MTKVASASRAVMERFWSKVDARGLDECWPWTAWMEKDGYGRFRFGNRMLYSPRVAFEMANGPLGDGQCALHECDNPPCCNPNHLFRGTKGDNARDRQSKGRTFNPRLGMSSPDCDEIRRMRKCGASLREIARKFKIGTIRASCIAGPRQ